MQTVRRIYLYTLPSSAWRSFMGVIGLARSIFSSGRIGSNAAPGRSLS